MVVRFFLSFSIVLSFSAYASILVWFPERTSHGGVVYAEKKLNKRSFVLIIAFLFFCRLLILLLLIKGRSGKTGEGGEG
jgi:hypothetical protein